MSVGVMTDKTLNLRDLHVSHTLGCVEDWNPHRTFCLLLIDKAKAKDKTYI